MMTIPTVFVFPPVNAVKMFTVLIFVISLV